MAKHLCYANSLTSVTNITPTTDAAVFTVPYACKCNAPQTFFIQFPTLMGDSYNCAACLFEYMQQNLSNC